MEEKLPPDVSRYSELRCESGGEAVGLEGE
jgi:hypothetical protein